MVVHVLADMLVMSVTWHIVMMHSVFVLQALGSFHEGIRTLYSGSCFIGTQGEPGDDPSLQTINFCESPPTHPMQSSVSNDVCMYNICRLILVN